MGASAEVKGHVAIFEGKEFLQGAEVEAPDLRAGAALVLAGLAARGTTVVGGVDNIMRGYEDFDGKLRGLSAEIEIAEDENAVRKFRLSAG